MGEDRKRKKRQRRQGIPIYKQARDGIWYADFRRYEGGARESLGTRDLDDAEEALADRKRELEDYADEMDSREGSEPYLEDFLQEYLDWKAPRSSDSTWANHERALGYLLTYLKRQLPRKPRLTDLTYKRLSKHVEARAEKVKTSTVKTELSGISSMLEHAKKFHERVRNVARLVVVPRADEEKQQDSEAVYLQIGEAIAVLQAAKAMEEDPASRCYDHLYVLLAAFLLTGGRRMEVFGLARRDVDLQAGKIWFRPNQWRSLKNKPSKRSVPVWSQLGSILAPYLKGRDDANPLVFPNRNGEPLGDLRSSLDTVAGRAKLDKRLTPKVFRHTYTATRIQTLDGGEPVSLYTVARELGHKGTARIEDTYGHLQDDRERLSEVRYAEADVVPLEEKRGA